MRADQKEELENLRKQHELLKKMLEQQEQLRALQGRQEALMAMQHSAEQALAAIEDTGDVPTHRDGYTCFHTSSIWSLGISFQFHFFFPHKPF